MKKILTQIFHNFVIARRGEAPTRQSKKKFLDCFVDTLRMSPRNDTNGFCDKPKYLPLIWGLLILVLIPTYAHHGNLLVDCGREAYYPTQVLSGKALYKDIFNIYGPFSYMYNALLFKIFGVNLNILYLSGCISAFFITSLTYLIARKFLGEFLSFSITTFTIMVGVFNTNLFNMVFPYSYGMLYGTVAVLLSLWLILKYEESPEKNLYLYLSAFFAGLCVANKYEFLPYFLVILYGAIKIKRLNFKQYGLLIASLIFAPAVCFAILFLQGMRLQDLAITALIINKMTHTNTLNYFYQHTGVFFHKKTLPFLTKKFFAVIIPLALMVIATTRKNKFAYGLLTLIAAFWVLRTFNIDSFVFLPTLIFLWFIFNFKNIHTDKKLMIITLSSILLNMKIFWGLVICSYGTYFVNLCLITLIALVLNRFKGQKNNQKAWAIYLTTVCISLFFINMPRLLDKTNYLSTPRGNFYIEKNFYNSTDKLIKYIQANTKKTDTVMIFPEGQLINFLTERKSDDVYGSLIPLYVETFGEDKIIEHFKQTKPEYIIFNNRNYHEYYYNYICNDYAQSFCSFVAQNYTQEKVIDEGFRYLIFKLKNN